MASLFLDKSETLTFEKVAMPVRLSESPDVWQRDIAGEIYKQLPYIGDYAVNVILDRVDAQRGYGWGSAEVTNKTDAPTQDQKEMPSVRIPIVIRDYLMSPLDVFLDGSVVYPLNEERLREKLFRTDTFELSTRKPSDKGLVDQLYPPMRTNHGMGTMGADGMGMGKYASLIEAIAPTVPEREAGEFYSRIVHDVALSKAASKNEAFKKLALSLITADRVSVEKTAQVLIESISPTVVQFQKLNDGNFKVKWANANAFMPQEDVVGASKASEMAGADLSKMQPGKSITMSTSSAPNNPLTRGPRKAEHFGKFEAIGADDNQPHLGYVVPILDMDMNPLELFLFYQPDQPATYSGGTNQPSVKSSDPVPGAWSVQDDIAGEPVDAGGEEIYNVFGEAHHVPDGSGVFVSIEGRCCLPPMTVSGISGSPDGTIVIQAQDMWAQEMILHMSSGIQAVTAMGPGQYAIPENLSWIPLNGEPIFLMKSEDVGKVNEAKQIPQRVSVGSTGPGEFSMDGAPLAKIAKECKSFLKKAEAEFLLVAMGTNPIAARELLNMIEHNGGEVKLACNDLIPLSSLHSEAVRQAKLDLEDFPYHLKQDLVKEAAVIDDADTADKVLSMNFINPENIGMFAKYLPELDQSAKKLAELLLASRLGLGAIDEGAIERAMRGMEQVIYGLKQLQQNVIESKS